MKSQKPQSSSSRRVIPSQRVVTGTAPVRLALPREAEHGSPDLRVDREGDLVRAIELTCSCGQQIRLICDYDSSVGSAYVPPTGESFTRFAIPEPVNEEAAE